MVEPGAKIAESGRFGSQPLEVGGLHHVSRVRVTLEAHARDRLGRIKAVRHDRRMIEMRAQLALVAWIEGRLRFGH